MQKKPQATALRTRVATKVPTRVATKVPTAKKTTRPNRFPKLATVVNVDDHSYGVQLWESQKEAIAARKELLETLNTVGSTQDLSEFAMEYSIGDPNSRFADVIDGFKEMLSAQVEVDKLITQLSYFDGMADFTSYESALFSFPALAAFAKRENETRVASRSQRCYGILYDLIYSYPLIDETSDSDDESEF